jgi:hypothetical protein
LCAAASASNAGCGGLLQPACPPAPTVTTPTAPTPTPPAATNPIAGPPQGQRVTVALFGDSVTQGIAIPDFTQDGIGGQLQTQLTSMGFEPGGLGFVPAVPYQFTFNASVLLFQGPVPTGGWSTVGYGKVLGHDGPNGYSAVTAWPQATASLAVANPDIEVLYTSTDVHCPFSVTTGGQSWSIDTYAAGPPAAKEAAITLPEGQLQLVVHGPSCGVLTFDGIVAHQPVTPGTVQVEIDNLGHAAHLPWLDFHQRVKEALIEQRYDVSVFMWGYIAELLLARSPTPYVRVMEQRAQIARMHGGACLVVQPAPIAATASAVALVKRLDQTVATHEHCEYTTVLAHLWPSAAWAENHGLLLVDGVHPSAAGYTEIAHALAPVIAKLVRGRVSPG